MINYTGLGGSLFNIGANNTAPSYAGQGYDAGLYQRAGESLSDYMRRLKAQREGGILGRGQAYPVTSAPTTTPTTTTDALDGIIDRSTVAATTSSSDSNYLGLPEVNANPVTLEDLVRQMSGQDTLLGVDPLDLLNIVPTFGTTLSKGAKALRKNTVKNALLDAGTYTEDQIDYLMDNPKVMMAVLGNDPDYGFEGTIDLEKLRSKGLLQTDMIDAIANAFSGGTIAGSEDINTAVLAGMGFDPFAIGPLDNQSNILSINPLTGVGTANIGGETVVFKRTNTVTEADEDALSAELENEYYPVNTAGTPVGTEDTGMFTPEKVTIEEVAPTEGVTVTPVEPTPVFDTRTAEEKLMEQPVAVVTPQTVNPVTTTTNDQGQRVVTQVSDDGATTNTYTSGGGGLTLSGKNEDGTYTVAPTFNANTSSNNSSTSSNDDTSSSSGGWFSSWW